MTVEPEDPRQHLENRNVRPIVAMPQAGLSGAAIALLCAALGIGLFFVLDGNRRRGESSVATGQQSPTAITSPPPLALPSAPAPAIESLQSLMRVEQSTTRPPAPVRREDSPPISPPPAYLPPVPPTPSPLPPSRPAREGNDSPLIIDLASADGSGNASAGAASGEEQAVRASVIRNRANLVPQGAMIGAVLETPIDSRRPGLVRAVVSRDMRGFDGSRILIPRGSRLIGEAGGDVKTGQKRVLVTWTRLVRPDGVAIRIGAPAADVLGGAGIRGKVNTHFFEHFGNAVLQSALTIGVNVASRPRGNSVFVGVPGQVGAAGQNLLPPAEQGPTIKVPAGTEISVFVAKDLDFSGTGIRR